MSQVENLLRAMVNGDKEAKITAITVDLTPTLFTSQLTGSYPRKAIWAFNNSNSGECFYGYTSEMTTLESSRPIPVKTSVKLHVTTNIPLYFCCNSGETVDLRIEEIS